MESARVALRALIHPVSLAAIGLLLLNDHVLKPLLPGPLTGKLSDVAGLVFFPLLLSVALGPAIRKPGMTIWTSVLSTGIWFGAINTIPEAARATERLITPFLSWRVTVDPTDLVALPALGLAVLVWRMAEVGPSRSEAQVGLSPLQLGALLVGAAASVATSCGETVGVQFVEQEGNLLIAIGDHEPTSRDGGYTWTAWDWTSSIEDATGTQVTEGCFPHRSDQCFRIDGGPYVEESLDGGASWRVAWQLPPGRETFLARAGGDCDTYEVAAVDLLITDGPEPLVLVAMRDDGLLRRLPDGTWERDVLGMAAPLADFNAHTTPEWFAALGAMLTALLIFTVRAHRRMSPPHGPGMGGWPTVGMLVLGLALLNSWIRTLMGDDGLFIGFFDIGVLVFALIGLAGPLAVWARLHSNHPRSARPHAIVTTVGIFGLGAVVIIPFLAWSGGWIASWGTAALIAAVASIGVVSGAWVLMSHTPRPRHAVPDEEDLAPQAARLYRPPWAAVGALAVGGIGILFGFAGISFGALLWGLLVPAGVAGVYLAARWSGYQIPAAITALAFAAATIPIAISAIGLTLRAIPALVVGFVLAAIALRPPNGIAIVFRLISIIPVYLVTRYMPPLGLIGPILAPLAVVAVDWLATQTSSRVSKGLPPEPPD